MADITSTTETDSKPAHSVEAGNRMKCPSCNAEIQDTIIIKAATSIIGARGRGASKARDPKKMREAGKKGGWPKGRPRKKHAA